jgi:hypothetical protein
MNVLWTTIVVVFVLGTLATVAWCLFEMSPFAHHADVYRDENGKWIGEAPRLD